MKVSIVSITKPLVEGLNTAEELITYTARVSSPSNQLNIETAPKLLKYCLDHGHYSIFEQVDMTVEIETSRAIAQQILRHRSFNFQEFSQRYAKADNGFETYKARRQDLKNRQNSIDDLSVGTKEWFIQAQQQLHKDAQHLYELALNNNIAKEQARFLLPLGVKTKLYMKGNIRSWIHYLNLRTDPSTQKEHRDVANAIKVIFIEQFPIVSEALGWIPIIEE